MSRGGVWLMTDHSRAGGTEVRGVAGGLVSRGGGGLMTDHSRAGRTEV